MDVILLRPLINQTRNAPIFLPLGLLHLAAPLVDAGVAVSIVDYEFEHRVGRARISHERFAADMCDPLIAAGPRVVAITVLADTLPVAVLLGRYLKALSPEVVVVFGGQGLFGTAEAVLERWPEAADYICKGEGEAVLLDLVQALRRGARRPRIAGTWMVVDGGLVDGGAAPLVDLDTMPEVPYHLLDVAEYLDLASPRIFDLYIGSGCRYRCRFCTTAPYWSHRFRARSPARLFREMAALEARYGVVEFNFLHDNFADDKAWLAAFLDYFREHNVRYRWGCSLRADSVKPDRLAAFREAGCFRVFTGADSGSPRLLREMSKMGSTRTIYAFYEGCRAAGIACETNTIVGFPGETDADLELSLEVVFDTVGYGGSAPDVSVLQPLPGASVTRAGQDSLEWVEERPFGAFEPQVALDMAAAHPDVFAGFYFIRDGNRPHGDYADLVRFVRFFSRHYFPVVYALKGLELMGYVALFEALRGDADGAPARLAAIVDGLGEPHGALLRDLFAFCEVGERVRGADAQQEVENIYSAPDIHPGAAFASFTLDHPVHDLVAGFPDVRPVPPEPAAYLFHLAAEGRVVKVRMPGWQAALWEAMSAGQRSRGLVEAELITELGARYPGRRVEGPVRRAAAYFETVLAQAADHASRRVAPERRYIGRVANPAVASR